MSQLTIRVFYPVGDGKILLRTDLDWDRDIEPVRVSDDGAMSEFIVDTDEKYFYFKPLLVRGSAAFWAKGENYLATTRTPERSLYPYFFAAASGSLSDAIAVPEGASLAAHVVRVYFPPGYDENSLKRYPVLYMHDGSNLFLSREAFGGEEWRVDENMDLLDAMNLIDKVIVVGVYAKDRMAEYTQDAYEAYGRFFVDTLKPMIDARLRTLPGPAHTAVMGSSLGGVVSFYLAFQYPEVFGKAACLSSTFGYRDDLMERVASEPKRAVRFYLDSGWPDDNYENTTAMRDQLLVSGYEPGSEMLHLAFPGALHDEGSWATRSHIPFQFFFGKA